MSVRTTAGEGKVALFCSTSGVAFGPVFDTEDEAERFLEWLGARDGRDPRLIREFELVELYQTFESREPTDVEMFGAGAA